MRSMAVLVGVGLGVAVLPSSEAEDIIYDSGGFEEFPEGLIVEEGGHDGWVGGAHEGGGYPWVWVGPPSKGSKSIRMQVVNYQGAHCELWREFSDLGSASYERVTVSFEVYRPSESNDWFSTFQWGWYDFGAPAFGTQRNGDEPQSLRTYPLHRENDPEEDDLWIESLPDEWALIELTWDYVSGMAQGRYNGELVVEEPIENLDSLTLWLFFFQDEGIEDFYFENAWLDNFIITGDKTCYPDFTADGLLDLFDFLAYVNAFNAGDAEADCDKSVSLDLFDFLCFVNAFNQGC